MQGRSPILTNLWFRPFCLALGHRTLNDEWTIYLDASGTPTNGPGDHDGTPINQLPDDVEIASAYQRALRYAAVLSVEVDFAAFEFVWNGHELFMGEISASPKDLEPDIVNSGVERALVGIRTQANEAVDVDDSKQIEVLKTQRNQWDVQRTYGTVCDFEGK